MSDTNATAKSRQLAADADLARQAAAGDEDAFDVLYQRHVQPAWRFAQAVSSSGEDAEKATTEAFVRVLRIIRRGRAAAAEQFRSYLLAAVYRNSLEAARSTSHSDDLRFTPVQTAAKSDVPVEHQLSRAFRSLPERWRAALWLTEVEGFAASDAASILGVSSAVAAQLSTRGHAGMYARVPRRNGRSKVQAIGVVLRAAALALPVGLAGATKAAWRKAMASERRRSVPAAGWLFQRAPRPLAITAAGLLAIGIIGLGVVGGRGGLNRLSGGTPVAIPTPLGGAPAPSGETGQTNSGTSGTETAGAVPISATSEAAGAAPLTTQSASTPVGGTPPRGPGTPTPPTKPGGPTPPTTQPVLQSNVNLGSAQLNLGLGSGSCSGLSAGSLTVGCTTSTTSPGVTGNLLGKSVTLPLP